MASETPQNLHELQARARESTVKAKLLNEEAEARLALIEDSRDVIHKLRKNIDWVNIAPAGAEKEKLKSIETCIDHLNLVKNVLREEDKNYRLVLKRLQIAFKLAQQNQYMLTEAQKKLVGAIVKEEEGRENKKNPNYVPWYPEQIPPKMATPPKDHKAQQYYNTLKRGDKDIFDKLHRYFFYVGYVKHPRDDFSGERKKFESLVTSRMAHLACLSSQIEPFPLTPAICKGLRASALKMVEEEQSEAMRLESPPARSTKRPKLTTIINRNGLVKTRLCNPIVMKFYQNLKHKHLRSTNCKTFMQRIDGQQNIPNYADKILTIQLNDLLQNKNEN